MWIGYEHALKLYFNAFLYVAKEKHHINTKYVPYVVENSMSLGMSTEQMEKAGPQGEPIMPWWMGNEDFHRAMRARLIEKKKEFYLPLFPDDEGFNEGKYFWPVNETQTFRII
jgi:hypothetical protein